MTGTHIQRLRGTTAQHANYTGLLAELTVDTDKKTVVVHDGLTAGGFPLARADALEALISNRSDLYVSVKEQRFGARGDGVADDTTAVRAAVAWGATNGATVFFPAGTYRLTDTVTIDESNNVLETDPRCRLLGAGSNCVHIKWEGGAKVCFHLKGAETNVGSGAIHSYSSISDMRIIGDWAGTALRIDNTAYFRMDNVLIRNFEDGIIAYDFLSSVVTNCYVFSCGRGITLRRNHTPNTSDDFESNPNSLDFFGCRIGASREWALYVNGGSCVNYIGGSIEHNASSIAGGSGTPGAVRLEFAGVEGAVGCNFKGVYFEGNRGSADIWIEQPDDPNTMHGIGATYNFDGCTFNRINSTNYTVNNIRFLTDTLPGVVRVVGCGFMGVGTYTPSEARPCIQSPTGMRGWKMEQRGNFFTSQVDAPLWTETPQFTAYVPSNTDVPHGTTVLVPFQALENYGNCFDSSISAFIAPYNVRMSFDVQVHFTGTMAQGDYVTVYLLVNGNLTRTDSAIVNGAQPFKISTDLNLAKNDVVTVTAWVHTNTGSGTRTIYSSPATTIWTGRPV